jgi:hypothetical protein
VWLGWVASAACVESSHLDERKRLGRLDVHLTRKTYTIAQRLEVMWHGRDLGPAGGMIPRAAVPHRVKPAIQFRPTGLTHRRSQISPVEDKPVRRQLIKMGRDGVLPTIDGQIAVRAIIGHNDQDVGFRLSRYLRSRTNPRTCCCGSRRESYIL